MAPIGGGPGGGGPVGSSNSFTGPAEALEITGDFCYAANNFVASSNPGNKIEFTSGNFIADVTVEMGPLINPTDATDGKRAIAQIQFNGATVQTMLSDGAAADQQTPATARIIIPPYTEVAILVKANADSASYTAAIFIAGRIYR